MAPVIDTPPNKLQRIDELYLFVSIDETGEGVCAGPLFGPDTMVPLIAADRTRVKALMPWARELAKRTNKKLKLIKFTTREEIREITPDGDATQ